MGDKIFVVTDSTACVSSEILAQYNNLLIVPLQAIFDGEAVDDGILGEEEFYEKLTRSNKSSTSAPSEGKFIKAFGEAVAGVARYNLYDTQQQT